MPISSAVVNHILTLSKLKADKAETEKFKDDLTNIVRLFNTIQSINTDGITPMISPIHTPLPLREDRTENQNHNDVFSKISPKYDSDYFIVPNVIE